MGKKKSKSSSAVEARRKKKVNAIPVIKKNPFEVRLFRSKHDVLGKKSKSDKGLPGVSRSKAVQKRKKTLLKEYKQRNKNNLVVDKRFGEYDDNLTAEEKMLKRFTLEKQRHHEKSGLYNLDADDDELTHFGQSLADMDNFDDAGLKLTDDEGEEQDPEENFGGFLTKKKQDDDQDDHDKKKTRQEIMDEVVANAKKKKYERQIVKEEAFEITQKLDNELKDIQGLLIKWDNSKPAVREEKPDDYDKNVKSLMFEAKATPTNRLKTEEEIAKEEKEKLEALEAERRKRMTGEIEAAKTKDFLQSADAIVETAKVEDKRYKIHYKDGKMVLPEGVELFPNRTESDIDIENGVEDAGSEDDSDDDEEEADDGEDDEDDNDDEVEVEVEASKEDDNNSEEEEEEESDHEDVLSDDDDAKESADAHGNKTENIKSTIDITAEDLEAPTGKKSTSDLPFTFEAPASLGDFLLIVKGRSFEDQLIILDRIKTCFHIKLDKGNRKVLQKLFKVLLEYLDHLCDLDEPPMGFINGLASYFFTLAVDIGGAAVGKIMQKRLTFVYKKMVVRKRNQGVIVPLLRELIFFKLVAIIFPTSDLNHAVTTPCLMLMVLIINRIHFRSATDIILGLLLLNIIYDHVKLSKRFLPEVVPFLAKVFYQAADVETGLEATSASILNLRRSEQNHLLVTNSVEKDISPLRLSSISNLDKYSSSDEGKVACVKTACVLSNKFTELYTKISSYHEIFSPCASLIKRLPSSNYPGSVQTLLKATITGLESKSDEVRKPLLLQTRKPIPLPLLEPRFEENYEVRSKRRAGDKVQNERQKLKYKIKKETKSAMREIKKDAAFLAKEQLKERMDKDAERKRKVKDLERSLADERSEINKMERMNKRRK